MTPPETGSTEPLVFARGVDVVELHLLIQKDQFAALEAVATRAQLTVAALIRRTMGDFLRPPAAPGFVGEVAGRPTAPHTHSEGWR